MVVGRAHQDGRGTSDWVKVRDSGGPTLGRDNVCVCGTWGSLEETRPAQVWEPRIQGREAPADTPSICSPGRPAAPGGWGDSCLQVYSCPGAHSPSHQLARRAEQIRTLNCRETEALNTGLAKSRVGASSSEPRDGLSCARSGTRPQAPQGCPTFTVRLPPLLRVCSSAAGAQAGLGVEPRGAVAPLHPGSRAFLLGVLGGNKGKWSVVC